VEAQRLGAGRHGFAERSLSAEGIGRPRHVAVDAVVVLRHRPRRRPRRQVRRDGDPVLAGCWRLTWIVISVEPPLQLLMPAGETPRRRKALSPS